MVPRRRDTRLDSAIAAAASRVLAEGGYAGFTVEGVASRLGIPKSTIYTRWESRTSLLAGLVADAVEQPVTDEPGESSGIRARLAGLLRREMLLASSPEGRAAAQMVLRAADQPDAALARVIDALDQRRNRYAEALRSATAAGELSSGVDVDLTVDMLLGAAWGRLLWGRPGDGHPPERIVAAVLPG